MRRLEAERIDGRPVRRRAGERRPGKPGIRLGWGRRCGLGALVSARQPPSMACGASRRSGVAPARRASHARHPGGVGAPPGWVLRPAREELADGGANAPRSAARCRSSSHGRRRQSPKWSAERRARRSQDARPRKRHLDAPSGAPLPSLGEMRKGQPRCPSSLRRAASLCVQMFLPARPRESGDPARKGKLDARFRGHERRE